jgi:predicted nucleic acid-binding protein
VIAVDSSVVVDLLGGDARADAAEDALRRALTLGPVVVCDVVVAEVGAGLGFGSDLVETLEGAGILYSQTELRSAIRAGEMQRRYKQRIDGESRARPARRSVPDFLIGAHALLQCSALITRDEGFFRDYFKGLRVIVPQPAPRAPSPP